MKPFSHQPRAAFAVLFFTVVLWYSCSADVNCVQVAKCCPTGMDDYGWIAAAVGWSLWFLTLILLCVDKVMKLRPDEHKHLVA
ncbi:transmembrane protein 213 [Patagioenas fasciata monilis]|uniref:Transmembrane protein 213 n=1 Tax=Patagioenas fasciata monilis TaxID=372326 RepID=A0A1V4K7S9_PATFA|nr:transmembrane protein 213 [Patagioenas fasciata monilis]